MPPRWLCSCLVRYVLRTLGACTDRAKEQRACAAAWSTLSRTESDGRSVCVWMYHHRRYSDDITQCKCECVRAPASGCNRIASSIALGSRRAVNGETCRVGQPGQAKPNCHGPRPAHGREISVHGHRRLCLCLIFLFTLLCFVLCPFFFFSFFHCIFSHVCPRVL